MCSETSETLRETLNTAGSWFLLTQVEVILNWSAEDSSLVEALYQKGFDRNKSGTRARVSAVRRLIRENLLKEALEKIRDSKQVNQQHPEAYQLAQDVLQRRFYSKEKL